METGRAAGPRRVLATDEMLAPSLMTISGGTQFPTPPRPTAAGMVGVRRGGRGGREERMAEAVVVVRMEAASSVVVVLSAVEAAEEDEDAKAVIL